VINKYWKTLEWLAAHKLGYLATSIYVLVGVIALPLSIVLLGVVELIERDVIEVFTSTLKSFIKGGKI
jgi:hypothetical protein